MLARPANSDQSFKSGVLRLNILLMFNPPLARQKAIEVVYEHLQDHVKLSLPLARMSETMQIVVIYRKK
jgi:hypothetical protein